MLAKMERCIIFLIKIYCPLERLKSINLHVINCFAFTGIEYINDSNSSFVSIRSGICLFDYFYSSGAGHISTYFSVVATDLFHVTISKSKFNSSCR